MANCYSDTSLQIQESSLLTQSLGADDEIPTITYKEIMAPHTDQGIYKWLHQIVGSGLTIVKNVPCVQGEVKRVAEKISNISHSFLYGEIFDVISEPTPVNIAYTPLKLNLHMDLAYYESPPGLQFLHCLQFDSTVSGGDSIFTDTFKAAEILRQQDPQAFEILCRIPATFRKIHLTREKPAWLEYQRPHISLNHRQQIIAVFWSPPFEGPLKVPFKDVDPYFAAYRKFDEIINGVTTKEHILKTRLLSGDLVVFNQRRMLHGREAFSNSGVRHLQGTYLNIDEVMSQYRVLREKYAKNNPMEKRVSNGSFA